MGTRVPEFLRSELSSVEENSETTDLDGRRSLHEGPPYFPHPCHPGCLAGSVGEELGA